MKYLKTYENYFEDESNRLFSEMKSHKVGDVIDYETMYNYTDALHDFEMDNDFIKDHILNYSKFKLVEIPVDEIESDSVSPSLVNDYMKKYEESGWYPPILYDDEEGMIIDGYHRFESLKKSGVKKVMCWVGI